MAIRDVKSRDILLNTKWTHHLTLGAVLGLWLSFFLIFISPFDVTDLTLKAKFLILPVYGVIVFVAYVFVFWIQLQLYKRDKSWSLSKESFILVFFFLLMAILSYGYYKSGVVNGTFSLSEFLFIQFIPIAIVISPFIIYGRILLNRRHRKSLHNKVVLKGDNKTDVLQLDPDHILGISSAQNYVEVYYLQNDQVKKELLRTTLKSVSSDLNHLTQVHRSHLINPVHFTKWKAEGSVLVRDIEVPVSRKYKKELEVQIKSSL